jgi:hypothetical protein
MSPFDDELRAAPAVGPRDPDALPGLRMREAFSKPVIALAGLILAASLLAPAMIFLASREARSRAVQGAEVSGCRRSQEPPLIVFFIFPAVGLAICFSLSKALLGPVLRGRRIYRDGVLAKGTVVFVKPRASMARQDFPGASVSEVFISYPSPTGGKAEARAECSNAWLLAQLPSGASVTIAFLPDKPGEALLLEAFLR